MLDTDRGLNLYRDSQVIAAVAESDQAPVTFLPSTGIIEYGYAPALSITRDRVAVSVNAGDFGEPILRGARISLFSRRLGPMNPQLDVALTENRNLTVVELGVAYPKDLVAAVMQEELPAEYLLKAPQGEPKSIALLYSLRKTGELEKTVNLEGTGSFLLPDKLEMVEDEDGNSTDSQKNCRLLKTTLRF